MANEEHLAILRQGVEAWNAWRRANDTTGPDLAGADLAGAVLAGTDLSKADLTSANLAGADLLEANLKRARLDAARLAGANLCRANLRQASLRRADLAEAHLDGAACTRADFSGAALCGAKLPGANLWGARLLDACLHRADFWGAILADADLRRADMTSSTLTAANLFRTDLRAADLTGSRVHGVSAWDVKLQGTRQQSLIITEFGEPEVAVDNLEVAQFVYFLLRNEKIRDVIDTIGKKGVLLLGRFTEGRLATLERLRDELRQRGFLPMVFNFDKPETKDFTETVRLLAGLSYFVIVDITKPRSVPLELQAIVPEYMIPFVPILEKGEEPFATFRDLWVKHRAWVLDLIRYPSVDRLVEVLDAEIIKPAEARFAELLARKAEDLRIRDV